MITGLPKLFDPSITGVTVNGTYYSRADYDYLVEQQSSQHLFYIENVRVGGDCCVWWCPNGKGYTRNLDEAWKVDEEKAREICHSRPTEDFPRSAADVDAQAVRHLGR